MQFSKKVTRRILWGLAVLVVLLILYLGLSKVRIFEGNTQATSRARSLPPPAMYSGPGPQPQPVSSSKPPASPTLSPQEDKERDNKCRNDILPNIKVNSKNLSTNVINAFFPICKNDPDKFKNCIQTMYYTPDRGPPSDADAIKYISQCK